jgi:hypothetical protein
MPKRAKIIQKRRYQAAYSSQVAVTEKLPSKPDTDPLVKLILFATGGFCISFILAALFQLIK